MSAPLIIIGAGQAAQQAIASLQGEGYAGEIMLFGDEGCLPYQRPPLSKAYLSGEMSAERLELRPAAFYDERKVDLRLAAPIRTILPAEHAVEDARGVRHSYSKLLIATGTRARTLPVPGADLHGVFTLRTMADVNRLKPAMQPGAKLVVIGGGYVGLETGAMAKKLGLAVSVVEAAPRILARVAGEETAAEIAALHARNGVQILTGTGLAGFEGNTQVTGVRLSDGRVLPADLVLLAVGAIPNVELAAAAGIALDNGIATDAATRTNLPDIYAAGDCASFQSARYGRRLRLESVQNAIDSAKAAASALLGGTPVYDPVPWFWSDQFDLKLQIAGLSTGATRVEREVSEGKGAIRAYLGERLIAVDSLNDPKSHLIARKTLAESVGSARAA